MSHGPNRYRAERLAAEIRAAKDERNPPPSPRARRIVQSWNDTAARGAPPEFFPTFQTALEAGCVSLDYQCPACRQSGTIDIRVAADRHHRRAPVSALIPELSCQRCCPNPPFARLTELSLPLQTPRLRAKVAQDEELPTYKIFSGEEEVGYAFRGMTGAGYNSERPWVWGYNGPLGRHGCHRSAATLREALAAFRLAWPLCGPAALDEHVQLHQPDALRPKKS